MHNFRICLPPLTDYEFVPNWAYPPLFKFAPSIPCLRPEHSQCKSSSSFWLTCSLALEFLSTLPVIYIWIFVHPTGCVLPQLEAKNAITGELVWGGQCLVEPSHPVLWLAERRITGSDPGQQNIIADTSCQPKIIARELCHLKPRPESPACQLALAGDSRQLDWGDAFLCLLGAPKSLSRS